MELIQEKIKAPGPPLAEDKCLVLKERGRENSKDKENYSTKDGSKYFQSKFAQFDAICGGGEGREQEDKNKYERVPMSQYQLNYQKPTDGQTQAGVNSVRMENGVLNIHIPCAYTYPYVPPPPTKPVKKRNKKEAQCQQISSLILKPNKSHQRPRSRSRGGKTGRDDCYDPCPPPFCSTVNNKGYFPPCPPPDCGGPPQGRIKTSMKWDYDAGQEVPFKKVEYGEELYEMAVQNMAKQMALEKLAKGGCFNNDGQYSSSTAVVNTLESLMNEDKCRDFGRPAFHTSLKASGDLQKALDHLNRLPAQMERIFMNDERFEPILLDRATRVLNVPREEKVFKDLISVEENVEAKERITKSISEQIKAVRPTNRSRDAEPNLLDYQESSFSRIRPTPVPPPPKPQAGVGVDIRNQTQYQVMDAEKQFEDAADKI